MPNTVMSDSGYTKSYNKIFQNQKKGKRVSKEPNEIFAADRIEIPKPQSRNKYSANGNVQKIQKGTEIQSKQNRVLTPWRQSISKHGVRPVKVKIIK